MAAFLGFVWLMVHEIRTPLQGVFTAADWNARMERMGCLRIEAISGREITPAIVAGLDCVERKLAEAKDSY